ncbi:MAG: putative Ig domain-containing protein [Verrucomicrobiota bacterium]
MKKHFSLFVRGEQPRLFLMLALLQAIISQGVAGVIINHDFNGNLTQITPNASTAKPAILSQPMDWTGVSGSTAVFAVRTAVNSANTYQWKKGTVNLPGATSESLVIPDVSATNEALYSVVITNSKGNVTSRAARLALDTDNDGLADTDETRLFSGLSQTGDGDFDKDGVTNAEELVDGTDPKLATSSFFRLSATALHGSVVVTPASATGRYKPLTKVSLTAKADVGYAFSQWQGTVNSQSFVLALTMTSHITETALFASDLGVALDAPDFNWQTGGVPGGWVAQRIVTQDGRDAAQSASLQANGSSWVGTYVQGPATVSFWWMLPVGSTSGLTFSVDGALNNTATANGTWTQATVSLADGVHALHWNLAQPNSAPTNAMAYLDRVIVSTSKTVPLAQAVETTGLNWATDRMNPWFGAASTSASHDTYDAALGVLDGQYRSNWLETYVTGKGTIEFWWRESGVNMTLYVDGVPVLYAGTSWSKATYTISTAGPHYLRWVADTDLDNYAIPEYGTAALDEVKWTPAPTKTPPVVAATYTLAQATGSVLAFQTGGNAIWTTVTDSYYTGPAAAASGVIGHKAESWIETRVSGPGNVTFYWRVDSESTKDLYTALLDGVVQATISGSNGWQFQTIAIPQGNHTVRWRYAKDAANKSGLDRAWLDNVAFSPTSTPVPTTPPGLGGAPVQAIADAVDNAALSFFSAGHAAGIVDTATTHDTLDAMKSGVIGHSQESWFETVLSGTGTLSFWWKVSSESGYDYLRLEVDDVLITRISGEVNWTQFTHNVSTGGLHKVRWRYLKDSSAVSGSDAGWVDEVAWTGASGGVGGGLAAYPGSIFAPPSASNQTVNVVGTGAWTATESLSWLSITGATSGNNAGAVTLAIMANAGAARSGTVTVAGQSVTVSQDAVQKPVIGLSFTTATVAVGSSFSASVSSYNSPTLFKATGLPPGLTISGTTGAISGIATAPGTFAVSVSASNAAGPSNPVKFSLVATPQVFALGTGQSFSFFPGFPHGPTKFVATGLPSGITVSSSTGFVSGAPLQPGTFQVTVTGTNLAKLAVPYKFTLVVSLPVFSGGVFTGIIDRHPSLNSDLGGFATLTVGVSGGVTGSVKLGATPWPLAGSMLVDASGGGKVLITIPRKGLASLLLNLTFDPGRDFGYAEGTLAEVTSPLNTAAVRVWCNRWSATSPATPFVGYYTNAIRPPAALAGNAGVPQGTGYLTFTVTADGKVTWTGKAADGSALAGSSVLWPTGEFPLFTLMYGNTGSMIGMLAISQTGQSSGRLDWTKKAPQPAAVRSYRTGFGPLPMALVGRRWVAPAAGQIVLGLADRADNARLDFTQGGIESAAQYSDVDQTLRITKTNTTVLSPSTSLNPAGVKLNLVAAKGTFTGSFKLMDAGVPRAVAFEGVLVSGETTAEGFFQLPALPLGSPANSDILSGKATLSPTP